MAAGTPGMLQGRPGDSQEGDSKRDHGCSCYSAELPKERGKNRKGKISFILQQAKLQASIISKRVKQRQQDLYLLDETFHIMSG